MVLTVEIRDAYERVDKLYRTLNDMSSNSTLQTKCYKEICSEILNFPDLLCFWDLRVATHPRQRVVKFKNIPLQFSSTENKEDDFFATPCAVEIEEGYSNAYIVELKDQNMIKVGKTNKITQRLNQLKRQYGTVKLIHNFNFNNEEDAYLMEVVLHKYFKEKYPDSFVPQDRFERAKVTKADLETLEISATKIRKMLWFVD